ncbi:hypothetical protein SAMN04488596_1822, partial [Halanaerobium congolense]|uniref:hypothetical protein n=1 Tax=Halanaerobium congolense TaxID=54121 RepID=UPI0008F324FA
IYQHKICVFTLSSNIRKILFIVFCKIYFIIYIDEYVKESNEVDYIKIGDLLEETFDKSWSDASKKRYGGALYRWYKWLKEQEKIVE